MQKEYDFSDAERSMFYHPDATHRLPVYLEPEVLSYFSARAQAKGVELNALINDLLKKDIEGVE